MENMFHNAVSAYLRDTVDPFYSKRFVELLYKVTVEDVTKAAMKYLPLFQDNSKVRGFTMSTHRSTQSASSH